MNVYQLYEITSKIRNNFWENNHDSLCDNCIDVFTQMISIAFKNKFERDELPKVFDIYDVNFNLNSFKKLIATIGLNADIKLIKNDYVRGNSFRVIQLDS